LQEKFFFKKEHVLILAQYTSCFTNKNPEKWKLKKFKTSDHLPQRLQDLFVTAIQTASQLSPNARANLHKVEAAKEDLLLGADVCLPGALANSGTHDATFKSNASNPSKTQISTRDHIP
jgi:hypothetical protein